MVEKVSRMDVEHGDIRIRAIANLDIKVSSGAMTVALSATTAARAKASQHGNFVHVGRISLYCPDRAAIVVEALRRAAKVLVATGACVACGKTTDWPCIWCDDAFLCWSCEVAHSPGAHPEKYAAMMTPAATGTVA